MRGRQRRFLRVSTDMADRIAPLNDTAQKTLHKTRHLTLHGTLHRQHVVKPAVLSHILVPKISGAGKGEPKPRKLLEIWPASKCRTLRPPKGAHSDQKKGPKRGPFWVLGRYTNASRQPCKYREARTTTHTKQKRQTWDEKYKNTTKTATTNTNSNSFFLKKKKNARNPNAPENANRGVTSGANTRRLFFLCACLFVQTSHTRTTEKQNPKVAKKKNR